MKARVYQWFRDHPLEADKRSCEELYKAFQCNTVKRKDLFRSYKTEYKNDLLKEMEKPERKTEEKLNRLHDGAVQENEIDTSIIPLPREDPGFEKFCRWFSIPEYAGLYQWQKEHHELTWGAKYEKTLAPRDHGKSVEYNNKYQWAMQYQGFDILLLGWTDRRKEIAQYVFNFFNYYGLIDGDKRTSPFHFRIINGGRFDCYLITSKETLGMHSEGEQNRFANMTDEEFQEYQSLFGVNQDDVADEDLAFTKEELEAYVASRTTTHRKLWISIDDPIDISFMKERHKEEQLELHFNSSLYGIHPDKWSFTGTRKFEGDFFDFITAKFGEELVSFVSGTMRPDGSLLCPERFTHPTLSTYEEDLKAEKRDLSQIREHIGEYAWHSEYEQNPHPITGEIWDGVDYVEMLESPLNSTHDICFITVDRATTTKISSSFTGCIIGVREVRTGNRIITHDYSGHLPFDKLLYKINQFLVTFHAKHENVVLVLIVEKQGGGDDFITMATNMREFILDDGTRVKNMIAELAIIEPVHSTGDKIDRITQRLRAPLANKKIKFMSTLQHSEIVKEILSFPHGAKLDAIDSLSNSEFVLLEIYHEKFNYDPIKELTDMYTLALGGTIIDEQQSQEWQEERELRNQIRNQSTGGRKFVFKN